MAVSRRSVLVFGPGLECSDASVAVSIITIPALRMFVAPCLALLVDETLEATRRGCGVNMKASFQRLDLSVRNSIYLDLDVERQALPSP